MAKKPAKKTAKKKPEKVLSRDERRALAMKANQEKR